MLSDSRLLRYLDFSHFMFSFKKFIMAIWHFQTIIGHFLKSEDINLISFAERAEPLGTFSKVFKNFNRFAL